MNNFKISFASFTATLMLVPMLILFVFFFHLSFNAATPTIVWLLSAAGWLEYFFCLYLWERKTGQLLCPYTLFLSFAFAFHYGQCLMWAFGIHLPSEIGTIFPYGSIIAGVPSLVDIIHTQALILMGLYTFHLGALWISQKSSGENDLSSWLSSCVNQNQGYAKDVFIVCMVAFVISTPLVFYEQFNTLLIHRAYGYGALLYGGLDEGGIHGTRLISWLYVPSIIGLLLSTNYKKSIRLLTYGSFIPYMLLCFASGNRGRILYTVGFFIWMHHAFYRRINWRKFLLLVGIAVLALPLLVAIRNIRSRGITLSGLWNAILVEQNPIVSAFFEMGNTMSISTILVKSGWNIYPFGNTYLLALPGMISKKLLLLFIPGYSGVSGWFSQEYLRITYGAGFSMIAEALINFGPYFCLVFLVGVGIVYAKMMYIHAGRSMNLLFMFFQICTARMLFTTCRNTVTAGLKQWFFSTLSICVLIYLLHQLRKR